VALAQPWVQAAIAVIADRPTGCCSVAHRKASLSYPKTSRNGVASMKTVAILDYATPQSVRLTGLRTARRHADHSPQKTRSPDHAGLREIHRCEVCGTVSLQSMLNLGKHPMRDDLVPIGDARICRKYPIEILFCETCCTAHQRFQIPKQELFPQTYHYRACQTPDVLNGMRSLVAACVTRYGDLSGKKVLDVGCNDGSLLSIFREYGAHTYGIEPTGAAMDASASGHQVWNSFFSEDVARDFVAEFGQPDIITFTNVFAHIEDLPDVIRALNALSNPRTKIVIENHYLGSILAGRQFDTFDHEHPRTYSATSFQFIAKSLGMFISKVEFSSRHGGNFRVFLSGAWDSEESSFVRAALLDRERRYGSELSRLPMEIALWRARKAEEIKSAVKRYGPLAGIAFPGRAAIPIRLLGLDHTSIKAVYEKSGSDKIGHFIPGTRIPILSDDAFPAEDRAKPLVNMAWHIADEIETYPRGRGFTAEIIRIVAPGDFAT
jgi:SAM-dependent methyltransferase